MRGTLIQRLGIEGSVGMRLGGNGKQLSHTKANTIIWVDSLPSIRLLLLMIVKLKSSGVFLLIRIYGLDIGSTVLQRNGTHVEVDLGLVKPDQN